ncbi:hypothetical protein H0H81_007287 [Sphagnurus paluster]|uniref:Amine oxidase domain-containing protein n=1 Tax=Sphagnurus paluster TaxID=117069 RepID=A0A9P7GM42_9AGAR|nr:hypothetical protein H0H81_007287 [Sphagnurus paluster]
MARKVKVAVVGSGLAGLTAAYLLSQRNTNTDTDTPPENAEGDVEFEVHLFEKVRGEGADVLQGANEGMCLSYVGADARHGLLVRVPAGQGAAQQRVAGRRAHAVLPRRYACMPLLRSQPLTHTLLAHAGYYPQLIALYKRLGVAFRAADFSYSFSLLSPASRTHARQITATMLYNGSSGLGGLSVPSVLDPSKDQSGVPAPMRLLLRVWTLALFAYLAVHIALCYLRMLFYALPLRACRRDVRAMTTFGEWAQRTVPRGMFARWMGMDVAWRDYTHTVLLPLFSAVCTAPEEDVLTHPVEEFLDYIWLTLGTHHYVVQNGVREVVRQLTATTPTQHIHLSSTITAISPDAADEALAAIHCATPRGPETHTGFHHVVFATQATRAKPLLESYERALDPLGPKAAAVRAQMGCLAAFEYRRTVVVNHTDATLLPDCVRDRRELNLICVDSEAFGSGRDMEGTELDVDCSENGWDCSTNLKRRTDVRKTTVPASYTMATHILRAPAGYPAVYQTTNPIVPPRAETILSVAALERAVLTVDSKEALRGLYREECRRWWQVAGQGEGRLGELQGAGRLAGVRGPGLWVCGSFACTGIPLLEGCVVSARTVVEQGVRRAEGVQTTTAPW